MKLLKEIHKKESGQALVLALILMLLGFLIIAPLLAYMGTGLKVGRLYEKKMDELYAADAGVEDAIYKIVNDYAVGLAENESYSYTLTGLQEVNSLPINVTVTKLSLIQGLVGEDEIKLNAPHEEWVTFGEPQATPNPGEGWVEYECHISLDYDGTGNRTLKSVGAFFSPFPGDESLISEDSPYGYINPAAEPPTPSGVITFENLEASSPETKIVPGGFAFIWRWVKNSGPTFDNNPNNPNNSGAFDFKFKVHSPGWEYKLYFIWSTFKEQDISYVTNAPDLHKWLIEATAGDTKIRSAIVEETDGLVTILTWEINPLH